MRDGTKALVFVAFASIAILVTLEGVTSLAYYQKNRGALPVSSTVAALQRAIYAASDDVPAPETTKLEKLLEMRAEERRAYPSYLFNPQLHGSAEFYHLANVPQAEILFCDEAGYWSGWTSDEIGFRNPAGQLGGRVDRILIGDSFTEGACEDEDGTFAGYFRQQNERILNLGRGGSGPLFQLATLREYGGAVQAPQVVWFVFTGNDMANLREEKTSSLRRYLDDPAYSQDLLARRVPAGQALAQFLDAQIALDVTRRDEGLPFPYAGQGYGETLDPLEARAKEVRLFRKVAAEILRQTQALGAELRIVVLNHPSEGYAPEIQDITVAAISAFATSESVPLLVFERQDLATDPELYTEAGSHFSAKGYRKIGARIHAWLQQETPG